MSKFIQYILLVIISISCLDQDKKNTSQEIIFDESLVSPSFIINLQDPNFQSSAIAIYQSSQDVFTSRINADLSDHYTYCHNEKLYRLGRFKINNFTRFDFYRPTQFEFQVSTNGNETSSNPKSLVFLKDGTALLSRYSSNTIWHIDPDANDRDFFLIKTIDLSKYADSDGIVEVEHMVRDQSSDFAYLFLNRLDRRTWSFKNKALLLKLDLKSFSVVDELALNLINTYARPQLYLNKLYIAGTGDLYHEIKKGGGIEIIDLESFRSSKVFLKDRQVEKIALTTEGLFFVEYLGKKKNVLRRYDLFYDRVYETQLKASQIVSLKSNQDRLYIGYKSHNSFKLDQFFETTTNLQKSYSFEFMPTGVEHCSSF
jgi:hypothetical protein